jgi:hypothetical protein
MAGLKGRYASVLATAVSGPFAQNLGGPDRLQNAVRASEKRLDGRVLGQVQLLGSRVMVPCTRRSFTLYTDVQAYRDALARQARSEFVNHLGAVLIGKFFASAVDATGLAIRAQNGCNAIKIRAGLRDRSNRSLNNRSHRAL